MTPAQAQTHAQSGFQALREQRSAQAQAVFETLVAAGAADADTHVGLAYAHAQQGNRAGAHAALDRALEHDGRHIRGLMLKADLLVADGRERDAAAMVNLLLKVAPPIDRLPPALQQELRRAQALHQHFEHRFARVLDQQLTRHIQAAADKEGTVAVARFAHALDLLTGRRTLYWPQPRLFHFPGLPVRQFFEREEFSWLPALEAQTEAIHAELQALLSHSERRFQPYVERVPGRPAAGDAMTDNPDWTACYLWRNGEPVQENLAACPHTAAALAQVPLARSPGRAPNVLFSRLLPGAHIPPHHGFVNTRLICHLPLIVPDACALRVGNETREWQRGRALVFDDTIEHEAWNRSAELRVVLLFEVWRPELSATERELVASLFEALGPLGSDQL